MSDFEVTLLGTSSSQPSHGRFPSSQIVKYDETLYMVDCGEGTQIQLLNFKVKRNRIKAIFISHLHGDHIFGLPGLVTSFMHYSRVDPLLIIGPFGIKSFIENSLATSESGLQYELIIKEYDANISQQVYSDDLIDVTSIPLKHRIPTIGFSIKENLTKFKINPKKIEEFGLKYHAIKQLKGGERFTLENGYVVTPEEACFPKKNARRYVYLSDTVYDESLIPHIENAELIYHETTYLNDMKEAALERMHATSGQAATIAKKANVGELIIGHYSSRYKDVRVFEKECREVFPNTKLGVEGNKYHVKVR